MKKSTPLWPGLGVGTAVLAVVSGYFIVRFAPSPIEIATVVVLVLLAALGTFGFLGTRRGHAATFVAIALVLPYVLFGTLTYASAQRASSEIGSILDDEDFSDDGSFDYDDEDFLSDEGGTYGSDPELDALSDACEAGDDVACDDLYIQSPAGSDYEATAEANGGAE